MHRTLPVLLIALAVTVAGCSGGGVATHAGGQVTRSRLAREEAPAADQADLSLLATAGTQFAVGLYAALRGEEGNLFFSPYSIAQALAMVYAGAEGETKRQMTTALGLELLGGRVHPAFNALDRALAGRSAELGNYEGTGFALRVANALWAQQGRQFRSEYLDLLATQYDAGVRLVDYEREPAAARDAINGWVAEQTEGRTAELIPEGALDALTRLVLVNTITFNASWQDPFSSARTVDALFFPREGAEVRVPMMRREARLRFAQSAGYRAVDIPYLGEGLVMTIILPDPGRFEAFQGALTADQLTAVLAGLQEYTVVDLGLPRFACRSGFSLAEPLQALGMTDAFQVGTANLSGIDGTRQLFIDDVVHEATIDVSEDGTEASAASAVLVAAGMAPEPEMPVTFLVDRPFLYLIRDTGTGAILFMGRVLDPTA